MPNVIYSLNNTINTFFSEAGASSSQIECDSFVHQKYGGTVLPVEIQGLTSYTVIAGPEGDKIIQFREQAALLDMNILELAKDIHGEVVPSCSELGWVGDPSGSPLAICEMNRLRGENYVVVRPSLTHNERLNTVYSLASFFAQSWQKGKLASSRLAKVSAIGTECYARFEYLANILPKRFLPAVTEIQVALPALLDGRYPLVLTHSDLNEINILVNPDSGKITGIVDWSDASILPFGFALYALESALGNTGSSGWVWFDDVDDLRDTFWKAFKEQTGLSDQQVTLIKLAGKAGILIRYGTAYDSGLTGMIGVRDSNAEDFTYLDALLS